MLLADGLHVCIDILELRNRAVSEGAHKRTQTRVRRERASAGATFQEKRGASAEAFPVLTPPVIGSPYGEGVSTVCAWRSAFICASAWRVCNDLPSSGASTVCAS